MKKDYCTLWPEGNWSYCCKMHDRRYGNRRLSRLQADILLYRCVKRKHSKCMATIMFLGVRLGGWVSYNRLNKLI